MPPAADSLVSREPDLRLLRSVRKHPGIWASLVSVAVYLTLGVLLLVPRGPPPAPGLGPPLSVLTAIANALTFAFLAVGWVAIRAEKRLRHRTFMELAFVSIASFLALYVARQTLAGTFAFGGPEALYVGVYLPLLIVHLTISAATVPLVLYNFLVGISRPLNQVGATLHPRVGRIIVPLWMASSLMGLLVFSLLRVYPAA